MLRALEIEDMEPIRKWRNECLKTLRTSFPLTREQQEQWYRDEVCNRNSRTRFWAITSDNGTLVGYGGIENIQWENGIGEISLLIDPSCQRKGYGYEAVNLIINWAFEQMGLHSVYAECYLHNMAVAFWDKVFKGRFVATLPWRKYVDGRYETSRYYAWAKDNSFYKRGND
jgi:RimJ/RimL family protein N-acetyltransferase